MRIDYKVLGDYIGIVDTRNRDLSITNLLGVSIAKKFIPSIANIVGTDLSNYKIVRTGQFAYGPVTSRNGEKISMAYLDSEDCIISSSYTVFEVIKKDELDPEYLMLWFSRPEFDRYVRYKSHGSVREIFDWNELCMVELPVPSISEQRNIVKAYKTITGRIALKQQINDNLEEQVYALYKQLTQVHDPNTVFESIATVQSGKRPVSNKIGNYQLVGAGGIMSYINDYNFDEQILITGRVGTHGVIQRFFSKCWASDNTLVIKSDYYEFSYHFLKSVDWDLLNRGSTQPLVTQTDIKNLPLYLPNISELTAFEATAEKIMKHQRVLLKEIESLNKLKDMIITSLSKH